MVLKNSQLFDMFLKSRKTATESLEMQILGSFPQFLVFLGCEKNQKWKIWIGQAKMLHLTPYKPM